MNQPTPIQESEVVTEADKRLVALFDQLENQQLEFLDQAGKRVIELSSAMLGIFFAVTAFGDTFLPPYLVASAVAKRILPTRWTRRCCWWCSTVVVRPWRRSGPNLAIWCAG